MPETSEQPQTPAEPVSTEKAAAQMQALMERAANPDAAAATPEKVVQEVRAFSGCTWDPDYDRTPFWPDKSDQQKREEQDSWL